MLKCYVARWRCSTTECLLPERNSSMLIKKNALCASHVFKLKFIYKILNTEIEYTSIGVRIITLYSPLVTVKTKHGKRNRRAVKDI